MLFGPCVRAGVWTGDDGSFSREDVERMVDQRARSIVSTMLEESRLNNMFPDIGSLEELWSTTDEDW